jgi:methanethiol S-methyltransferase
MGSPPVAFDLGLRALPRHEPAMNRFCAILVMALAFVLGVGSLLLFYAFLVVGPVEIVRLPFTELQAWTWNTALSLAFFVQHSGMIRAGFRRWLGARMAPPFHPAIYAIASGAVLAAVVLLWQTSATTVLEAHGPVRLLFRALSLLGFAGFAWGVQALATFDPFGRRELSAHLRGRVLPTLPFVVRGPYLWVRHPLYTCTLALIWSGPDITLDRLSFNLLWTAWIVVGTLLEERDLVAAFGDEYRRYQALVPMLLPWRGPAGHRLARG